MIIPPRPRSLLYPESLRLPRLRNVTIICGLQCSDGTMMCADTEETISDVSKHESDKMRVCGSPAFALCGGAGDAELIEFSTDLIEKEIPQTKKWPDVLAALNGIAARVFSKHVRAYVGFPKDLIPWLSMLIAVRIGNETKLFRWSHNFVRLIPNEKRERHTAIGIGDIQALQLLRQYSFSLPAQDMFFFAVRTMHRVKRLVPGCGGRTRIFVLRNDQSIMWWTFETIEKVEKISDKLDGCFTDLMWFVTRKKEPSKKDLNDVWQELKKLRQEYLKS